jgi:protein-S-isoprenylcysteine O-methyltransferase Ste14
MSDQSSPDSTKIGKWLFARRTSLPVPIALALLFVRWREAPPSPALMVAGVAITTAGEALRLWAVEHIGAISRTRSDRLGPLIATGPFALIRNPLYVGNMALWIGFTLTARLVWLAPIVLVLLGLEYHAIVKWEEHLLQSRIGDSYRDYLKSVPRWWPALVRAGGEARGRESAAASGAAFSWRETLFSERGTLIAIAVGYGLLWIKLKT